VTPRQQTLEGQLPGEGSASITAVDPDWAWARYQPSSESPWGIGLAGHLFRRAGFGGTWAELQKALEAGPHATIDGLLQPPPAYAAFANEFDQHEAAAARSSDGMVFDAWWLRRLRESPWPLLEKMTLFWHDHFAIRSVAVGDLRLMHSHIQLLRSEALTDFPALLKALAGDPAMYNGLGGAQNRKARPNLHFARPWLDAFTVGPEAATAGEVENLARAWTGWFIYSGKLRFVEREHDQETKRLLGHEGNWDRDEAVQLLADHPNTARALARRLFRAFISETVSPPDSLVAPLVAQLKRRRPLKEVLALIFHSNLFFSKHALGQCIKSPVELVVGLVRSLEGGLPSTVVCADLADLGQRLDEPPTVHGWVGGADWLNTITLAARTRLCGSLVHGSGPYGAGLDPAAIARRNGFETPDAQTRFLFDLLVPNPLPDTALRQIAPPPNATAESMRAVLGSIMAQPEFQLK